MLLNSASGLRLTSWTPTCHVVPYHNISVFPPSVHAKLKAMTPLMSLAHQGRVTSLQGVDWSWWSSLSCSDCRSGKTCSLSAELWDDQSLGTSGTEMESRFPKQQRGSWWWADGSFDNVCEDCTAVGSHKTHLGKQNSPTKVPNSALNSGLLFSFICSWCNVMFSFETWLVCCLGRRKKGFLSGTVRWNG